MFLLNPNAARRPYDPELRQVLSVSAGRTARERPATWPLLARGDVAVFFGESGAAGLAGLRVLMSTAACRDAASLGADSRVLLINTEGATAPRVYAELVGRSADQVLSAQAAWLERQGTAEGPL